MPLSHENLSLDRQHPQKWPLMVAVCMCDPSTEQAETGGFPRLAGQSDQTNW